MSAGGSLSVKDLKVFLLSKPNFSLQEAGSLETFLDTCFLPRENYPSLKVEVWLVLMRIGDSNWLGNAEGKDLEKLNARNVLGLPYSLVFARRQTD